MSGRKQQHQHHHHQQAQPAGTEFTVFIRDFPFGMSDAELLSVFAPIKVVRGNIVKDPQTKQPKGYAFAHFATDADMQKAISIANGKEWPNGQKLTVRPRDPPAPVTVAPVEKPRPAKAAKDADSWQQSSVRVAVFFGTFDPVHENQIAMAKHAVNTFKLNQVVFVPSPDFRFKPFVSPMKDRIDLLKARVALENTEELGEILAVYTDLQANQSMNWQGRALICDAIRTTWAEEGSVKLFQLMGQDSYEEKSAQEALRSRHVRDNLRRSLLVYPREGGKKEIDLIPGLETKIEVATTYHDAIKFSSTKGRIALSKGEATDAIHPVVRELVAAKPMYTRIDRDPSKFVTLIVGPPAIGKGTLAEFLAQKYQASRFSGGDFYRASLEHPKYAAFTEKVRTDVEKWGAFLVGTAEMCLTKFIAESHNSRFVADGFDETEILVMEKVLGGHCVDVLVSLHCSTKTLQQRIEARGRDTPEERARRLEKYEKNKEMRGKQLKSLVGSPRNMTFVSIDAEPPVETYVGTSKLQDTIEGILATKKGEATAPVLTTPAFIAAIVAAVYESAEFDALCKEIDARQASDPADHAQPASH